MHEKNTYLTLITALAQAGDISGVAGGIAGMVTQVKGASLELIGEYACVSMPCPSCNCGGTFSMEIDISDSKDVKALVEKLYEVYIIQNKPH